MHAGTGRLNVILVGNSRVPRRRHRRQHRFRGWGTPAAASSSASDATSQRPSSSRSEQRCPRRRACSGATERASTQRGLHQGKRKCGRMPGALLETRTVASASMRTSQTAASTCRGATEGHRDNAAASGAERSRLRHGCLRRDAATRSALPTSLLLVQTSSRRPAARSAFGGFRSACVSSHAGDAGRRCWSGRHRAVRLGTLGSWKCGSGPAGRWRGSRLMQTCYRSPSKGATPPPRPDWRDPTTRRRRTL